MAKISNGGNVACPNGVWDAMNQLRDTLTKAGGAGWTYAFTSNGTTQLVAPTYGTQNFSPTTNNSYFVLRDPSGKVWLLCQRTSATAGSIIFTLSAPTGGTGSALPTALATDTFTLVNNTTVGALGSSPVATVVSYDSDDNTKGIRSFYLYYTNPSNADPLTVFIFEAMEDGTFPSANNLPFAIIFKAGSKISVGDGVEYWPYDVPLVLNRWMAAATALAYIYGNTYLFGDNNNTNVGVNPWSSQDEGISIVFGRAGVSQPGCLGGSKHLKFKGVNRQYPDTVNLASDAFVYAGALLIPWPNGVAPA